MADNSDPRKHFPAIDDKLKAGPVKTAYDRDKEQASKKRRREADEERVAYAEFTEHMGVAPDAPDPTPRANNPTPFPQSLFGGPRRRSPPSAVVPGVAHLLDPPSPPRDRIRGYGNQDIYVESTEPLPPRPTLLVKNLPPDFDQGTVLSTVFGAALQLHQVIMVNVVRPRDARPFAAAVAICYPGTPAKVLDEFCRKHKGSYLGRGYYLDLHKYDDDHTIDLHRPLYFDSGHSLAPRPFGAIPVRSCPVAIQAALGVPIASDGLPAANAAPDNQSFEARADRYQPVRAIQRQISTVVIPRPPLKLSRVKLINWTVENIIRHGSPFEAMLMNDVEVQLDPKWDFLWDSSSSDGAWFYWRLYETATGYDQNKIPLKSGHPPRFHLPYWGHNMPYWVEPFEISKYYGALTAEEVSKHHDFTWGDDDLSDEDEDYEARRRHRAARPQRNNYSDSQQRNAFDQPQYLGTAQRAKFIWLLKDVPATRGKLASGDVMSITGFAIEHSAAHGEVVDLLIANVIRPFRSRPTAEVAKVAANQVGGAAVRTNGAANGARTGEKDADNDTVMGGVAAAAAAGAANDAPHPIRRPASGQQIDSSSEKLVALSLITDVLAVCAMTGVRDSWFYRQGFADNLLNGRVFERLGVLHLDEGWGFMRKGNFERSIMAVVDRWDERSFFDVAKTREMRAQFVGPGRSPDERK